MSVYRIDGKEALKTHDKANPERDRIVEAKATDDGDIMVKTEVEG